MGYETNVEEVAAQNGDLWHRVQIGPFQSRSVVANARSKLISNGIEALLLKRKSDS
jgi:cell division protein FtsN